MSYITKKAMNFRDPFLYITIQLESMSSSGCHNFITIYSCRLGTLPELQKTAFVLGLLELYHRLNFTYGRFMPQHRLRATGEAAPGNIGNPGSPC